MLSKVISAAVHGIDAYVVNVEIYIASGLPSFSTVGLPDAAVRESKDRVVSAIKNSGFDFPTKKVTVNLAPADIKKEGPSFDLPIALGILSAEGYIKKEKHSKICFIGELALDGSLRSVKGVLPIAIGLRKSGFKALVVPIDNALEASAAKGLDIIGASSLLQVVRHLNSEEEIGSISFNEELFSNKNEPDSVMLLEKDFSDIKGQFIAKRAFEVAAAGEHNIIMIGPPGSGKTMLAKRMPGILPPMSLDEALETTKIHSVAGLIQQGKALLTERAFRSPHHTTSDIALIGGGTYPRPGEVSLAHNGVLFLDELPEFHRNVLEVLRQPLEEHFVSVSRAKQTLVFPSSFMLIGAMNPCPCGNYGHAEKECLCSPFQIKKYRSKISGPLMDRVDIHLEVPALKISELTDEEKISESSGVIRKRVLKARIMQLERFKGTNIRTNARMGSRLVKKYCRISKESKELLAASVARLGLSARAYDRILKVSRTIADIENSPSIETSHVAEAINYRSLDRF